MFCYTIRIQVCSLKCQHWMLLSTLNNNCTPGIYQPCTYIPQLADEVSIVGTICTPHTRLHSNSDNCAGRVFLTGHTHCGNWSRIDSTAGRTALSEQFSCCLIGQRVSSNVGATCEWGQVVWITAVHGSQSTAKSMQMLYNHCSHCCLAC